MKKERKNKKSLGYFVRHSKSSAALVTVLVHALLIVMAFSFVAIKVITRNEVDFKAQTVKRPNMQLRKLQIPVNIKKPIQKPRLRKQIVVKPRVDAVTPEFKMPEIAGVKGGLGAGGGGFGSLGGLGFTMPELDFFGAKAKGEKIVFVVHFGPATISAGSRNGQMYFTPFSRMTGLTIRNRLADMIDRLPEYAMFNVICYFSADAWAMDPVMQQATPVNKQKVKDWMSSVNPLEGDYQHCFEGKPPSVRRATRNYPTRVDDLPFYATKWCYPYTVPEALEKKYAPDAPNGFLHWGRAVAWAILEQKADTIFVLTTNYIDGWRVDKMENGSRIELQPYQPQKMANALQAMCADVYGPNRDSWPTINVVVLAKAGQESRAANRTLTSEFGPLISKFSSDGSIIEDITDYMTDSEEDLYFKYKSEYGVQ